MTTMVDSFQQSYQAVQKHLATDPKTQLSVSFGGNNSSMNVDATSTQTLTSQKSSKQTAIETALSNALQLFNLCNKAFTTDQSLFKSGRSPVAQDKLWRDLTYYEYDYLGINGKKLTEAAEKLYRNRMSEGVSQFSCLLSLITDRVSLLQKTLAACTASSSATFAASSSNTTSSSAISTSS